MRYHSLWWVAMLLTVTACQARQGTLRSGEYGLREGAMELVAQGNLDVVEDTTTLMGHVGLGYFLTENHEVGVSTSLARSDSDSGGFQSESTSTFLSGSYSYNHSLNESSSIYAGPHLGLALTSFSSSFGSMSDTTFSYGLHAGFRSFITANAAWIVEYRYTTYDAGGGVSVDRSSLLAGLSVLFGGGR